MRLAYKLLAAATLLLVLVMVGFIGDLVLNKRRVFYGLLGRDALVAACRAPLEERLRALGFQPAEVAFGETPDITISTLAGKTLKDTITFADGAAEARIDGRVACSVRAGTVSIDVQTTAMPTRAG